MRVYRCRSVSQGLFSLGLLAAALAVGCADPAAASGEFELQLDQRAPFAVVGQFRLSPVLGSGAAHEFGFDATTSRTHARLPAGQYVLTLTPGARLVCPEDGDPEAGVITQTPVVEGTRLVQTWPQTISITAGRVTTAHVGVGSSQAGVAAPRVASAADPCPSASEDGVRHELSSR